jgi:hypothetical protein
MVDDAASRSCHICEMRNPGATDWVSAAAVPRVPRYYACILQIRNARHVALNTLNGLNE